MTRPYQDKENEDQIIARRLYVEQGMTPEQIANQPLQTNRKRAASTIYRWVWRFGWATQRKDWLSMPYESADLLRQQINNMLKETAKVNSGARLSQITDGISKMMSALDRLEKKQNRLGSIIWATNEMNKFLKMKRDGGTKLSDTFIEEYDKFLGEFQEFAVEQWGGREN